ncbi:MAG TPA: AtpZ/AtpI family protein [Anaerolineales bacterium]|nr:AtpZ/AtpI family protein [Anaerolineales bacterium]
MTQSEQKGRSILTNVLIVLIGQMGCLTLVIVLASVFGGLWLDKIFDTKPVITLALLFAGIPVSVLLMLNVGRKTLARMKDDLEKESDTSS